MLQAQNWLEMLVLYYFSGEPGESPETPNGFELPINGGVPSLNEFITHFPPLQYDPRSQYHFRFRGKDPSRGWVWIDVSSPTATLPLAENDTVFAKVERIGVIPSGKRFARLCRKKEEISQSYEKNDTTSTYHDNLSPRMNESQYDMGAPTTGRNSEGRRDSGNHTDLFDFMNSAPTGTTSERSKHVGTDLGIGSSSTQQPDFFGDSTPPLQSPSLSKQASDTDLFDFVGGDTTLGGSGLGSGGGSASVSTDDVFGMGFGDSMGNSSGLSNSQNPRGGVGSHGSNNTDLLGGTTGGFDLLGGSSGNGETSNLRNSGTDLSDLYAPASASSGAASRRHTTAGIAGVGGTSQPLNRAALAHKREMEVQSNVNKAVQEKRERDAKDAAEAAGIEEARKVHDERLTEWAYDKTSKQKRNVRTLLTTMHTVLWQPNKWKEVGLADVIQGSQVKAKYRKAMLIVHPDRLAVERPEIRFIAKRVFEAVNDAYREFEKLEGV